MTSKSILVLMLASSFAVSTVAKSQTIEQPEVNASSSAGVGYWLVKKMVFDFDKMLNENGFLTKSCVYRSNITGQDTPHKGLGPCLLLNFMESMDTDEISGTTYFWLEGSDTKTPPLEIHWRPPRGGFGNLISQYFSMTYEGSFTWFRGKPKDSENVEDLPYREFIGGELKLIIPNEAGLLKSLGEKGNPWVIRHLQNVRQVELNLKPTEVKDGLVVHTGLIHVEHSGSGQENGSIDFAVRTNLNVLITDRPFSLKVKSEIKPKDIVSVPGVSHAP